jgi:FkbM family methyltransferase
MELKTHAARMLMRLSRWYLQSSLTRLGKAAYWDRVCVPYLGWRKTELICRTHFGARMSLRPCEFIQNRILFFGTWEPHATALFHEVIRPGDVVIDVGANVGYYTLLAAHRVGRGGRVYAVEPAANTRRLLRQNLRLNGLNNVTVIAAAAWDEAAAGRLHLADVNCGSSSLRALGAGEPVEEVSLVRLDDVILAEDRSRVSLIKLDIEGAEAHALAGLSATLAGNGRLRVIAEVNASMMLDFGSTPAALFDYMGGFGFRPYLIPNDYRVAAYLPPIRHLPVRPMEAPPEAPSYVLFSRTEPV